LPNPSEPDASFIDADGHVRVVARASTLATILRWAIESQELETGGVLIGKYVEDNSIAVVEEATSAPPDSSRNASSFVRGTRGLRSLLRNAWERGLYYVGEWHSHPKAKPLPSKTDGDTLAAIACNPDMHCMNPVLFIVGGDAIMYVSTVKAGELKRCYQRAGERDDEH
jgi:integrative and conjugative element protein (TIGR02256 family)